jgi:hypothetical protein
MPDEEIPPKSDRRRSTKQRIISRFEHLSGFTKGVITWFGAVASLVAALVGATYLIAPDLKPRDKLGATLDRIGIVQNVDYRSYEAELNQDGSSSPENESTPSGIEVLAHASLYGFSDQFYSIRITLLEAKSFKKILLDHSSCQVRSPKANEDGVTWRCWASSPPAGTHYIVRAEIFDDGKYEGQKGVVVSRSVLLDFLDSPEFIALPPT